MKRRAAQNRIKSSPELAKGQLWKMKGAHIQIVGRGKMLVEYKMLRNPGDMRRTQMTELATLEGYLRTNRAKLVKGFGAN